MNFILSIRIIILKKVKNGIISNIFLIISQTNKFGKDILTNLGFYFNKQLKNFYSQKIKKFLDSFYNFFYYAFFLFFFIIVFFLKNFN